MSPLVGLGISALLSALPDGKTPAVKQANVQTGSFKDEMSAVDKFLKYQEMTPAQKIRASFLSQHGITEEDLNSLPPEERKKVEEMILDEIKRKLGVKEIRQNAG